MTKTNVLEPSFGQRAERIVGRYDAGEAGPTLLVAGGIHGNEPAGVEALRRVFAQLHEHGVKILGRLEGIVGNLGALREGQRFLDRDLNRQWLAPQVGALRARDPELDGGEDREQRALLAEFDRCVAEANGPLVFADLHTSSADGPPFCCMGDTMPNRRIAFSLPIPVILGLEEAIDGAVLEYFNERGLAGIAIEGGRHSLESTVDNLEAAVWIVMVAIGMARAADVPGWALHRERLRAAARGAPAVVEIRDHHRITRDHRFVMRPGYVSFQSVRKGEHLADERSGPVLAKETGLILLPLYQGLGEDGFFMCRQVATFWLWLAGWLRAVRLDLLLPVLPGVRRHPDRAGALRVNPKVARWLVREVFHLLGFRRCRPEGDHLVYSRRDVAAATAAQLPWRR